MSMMLLFYSVLSYQQVKVWKNDTSLFTHGVITDPRSGTAHTNLATLYRKHGRDDLALRHYRQALQLDSSYYIIHYNMARIHHKRGDDALAIGSCRKSLRSKPDYARSLHLLGQLLESKNTLSDEAFSCFEQAHRMSPETARFAISYALANARREQYKSAYDVLMHTLKVGAPSPKDRQSIEGVLVRLRPYLKR